MRYVYGRKMKTLRDRLTTGAASLMIVASNASIGLPFLIAQKAAAAPAPQTTQKVLQTDFANSVETWTYHDDVLDSTDPLNAASPNPVSGQREIANKPAGATLDDFAAVKLTASGGQKFNLASLQYSGTKLSEIEALGFDLYTNNPGQAYINLDVNFNSWKYGPGMLYHGRLIYVPQGVTSNTWGSHEATGDGLWMWSRFADNGNKWPDGVTTPARTWDSIASTFPNAHISSVPYEFLLGKPFGSLYLRADGDSPVTAYFDNVYLATASQNIKYNFEMPHPDPTNSNHFSVGGTVYRDYVLGDCTGMTSCLNRAENLSDWEMRLYKEDSGGSWQLIDTETTAANGTFTFAMQSDAGIYHTCEVLKPGWTQQLQTWNGSGYLMNTPNLSGDPSEGPYCNTLVFTDVADRSFKSNIGNVAQAAAITKPTVDYEAFGVLSDVALEAHDIGAAGGNVQWAVRADTCDPNTNTLFGNVDGFNTPFTWVGGNFTANISGLGEGEYCFVFNPNQGGRLTRWFTIQDTVQGLQDLDGDGNTDGDGRSVQSEQTNNPNGGQGESTPQVLAASTGLAGTGAFVMPFAFLGTVIIGASLLTVKRQKQD